MPWRENKGVCQFKRSHGLHDYLSSEFRRMLDGNKIFNKNLNWKYATVRCFWGRILGDRIGDARIFGAARAENKSKNLFFAESREK